MNEVATTLAREEIALARFLQLLGEEQEALKSAHAEALPPLAAQKTALVDELNRLEAIRGQLVGGSSRKSMENWLANHAQDRDSPALWQRLGQLSQEARHMNQLNAKLLDLHLRKTSEALEILTRHTRSNLLYGSNGQAEAYTGSRIIDSA